MAAEVFFEPENEEFNLYIDNKEVKRGDKSENVIGLGFRITPEASFYHEYPDIDFDINGFVIGDLEEELKDIK
ncbi:hypothetical protein PSTG_18483, partial [Puccinia striiformis f. sp. tritici PST-78]